MMAQPKTGNKKLSQVAQLYPTLCNPVDCSLPGSSVHGILQAIVLEWVAISFCRRSSRPRDRTRVSRIGGRHFNLWGWECNMQFRIILTNSHTCLHAQSLSHVWFPATPWTVPARLLRSWDFLDENTGVGCRSLLQQIFPTQGSNLGLRHCRQILYRLSYQGKQKSLTELNFGG